MTSQPPDPDDLPPDQEFRYPSWSPDGSKIVFEKFNPNRTREIYTVNADGTGQPTPLPTPACGTDPAWSPDGSKIAFVGCNGDLNVMNPDGSEQRKVTTDGDSLHEQAPAWSPDGTRLVFHGAWWPSNWDECDPSCDTGSDLFTINADGTGKTNITNTPDVVEYTPSWQPNSAPVVTPMRPAPGSTTTNRTPRILAKVTDVQDTLTTSNITLSLDDRVIKPTAFSYDPSTDRLSYKPDRALPYGRHTVRVVAEDTSEVGTTRKWSFRVVRP